MTLFYLYTFIVPVISAISLVAIYVLDTDTYKKQSNRME